MKITLSCKFMLINTFLRGNLKIYISYGLLNLKEDNRY